MGRVQARSSSYSLYHSLALPRGQAKRARPDAETPRPRAPVRVRLSQSPYGASGPVRYAIQAGSFAAETSARALKTELEPKIAGVHIVKALVGGEAYYRVRVGNFASRTEAQGTAERLAALGYRVLVMESSALP